MKRQDYNNHRRESVTAMVWLVLFAMLVVGAVQQRFSAPTSVEVAQTLRERVSTFK